LTQLQYVHNQVKDKNEIAIIKEYNCIARRYTIILTSKKYFQIYIYNYYFTIISEL